MQRYLGMSLEQFIKNIQPTTIGLQIKTLLSELLKSEDELECQINNANKYATDNRMMTISIMKKDNEHILISNGKILNDYIFDSIGDTPEKAARVFQLALYNIIYAEYKKHKDASDTTYVLTDDDDKFSATLLNILRITFDWIRPINQYVI